MIRPHLKKTPGLDFRRVLLFVSFALVSFECASSIVDLDDPKTITNGNVVTSSNPFANVTKVSVDFTGTLAVVLAMDINPEPPALPAPRDEFFSFRLLNETGQPINNLEFQFVKPEGINFEHVPALFWWASSVQDYDLELEVDWNAVEIEEADNFVRVNLPFSGDDRWDDEDYLIMNLKWEYFNYPVRADWLLVIDPEEQDFIALNNLVSGLRGDVTAQVPIPGAVWLFASGLVGFFPISSRKRNE